MSKLSKTLWNVASQEANSTLVYIHGINAIKSGTFPISLSPLPPESYQVGLSDGTTVTVETLTSTIGKGVSITLGVLDGAYRFINVASTGSVGIVSINVTIDVPATGTEALTGRVTTLEAAVTPMTLTKFGTAKMIPLIGPTAGNEEWIQKMQDCGMMAK